MPDSIIDKLLQRIGHPALVKILAEDLKGAEMNSLLLEVFNQRV